MAHLQFSLKEVILLDILEVPVCIYLEFSYCKLVRNDDSMRMCLKGRKGAFMRICSLNRLTESVGLLVAESKHEHFLCIHDRTDTDSQSSCRNLADVSVKEA